jgi:hypothetical protein
MFKDETLLTFVLVPIDFCGFILLFKTTVLSLMSLCLSLGMMKASHSRGFVKTLTELLTYTTFLVKMFLNEHFYQGDDDGSQYVN